MYPDELLEKMPEAQADRFLWWIMIMRLYDRGMARAEVVECAAAYWVVLQEARDARWHGIE